jgi:hypothetical protein
MIYKPITPKEIKLLKPIINDNEEKLSELQENLSKVEFQQKNDNESISLGR